MKLFIFVFVCSFISLAMQQQEDAPDPLAGPPPGPPCSRRSNNLQVNTFQYQWVPAKHLKDGNLLEPNNMQLNSDKTNLQKTPVPNPFLNSDEDLLASMSTLSSKNRETPSFQTEWINRSKMSPNARSADKPSNCNPDREFDILEDEPRRSMPRFDEDQDEKDTLQYKLQNSDNNALTALDSVDRDQQPIERSMSPITDPAQGYGQANMVQARPLLMDVDRVCYACSTVNNPKCWNPDRSTTVKYCRKGNDACVTKSFGKGKSYTLIRDCGSTCEQSAIEGFLPKFKHCSICHHDLCNGAYSINSYNLLYSLIIFCAFKYTF